MTMMLTEKQIRGLNLDPSRIADSTIMGPGGCEKCRMGGYKGRMGLHELMVASDGVKRLVQKKATVEELRNTSMAEGMTTLLQDGIQKVINGHTDFKQVRAVCMK